MTQDIDSGITPSPLQDPIAWMSCTVSGKTWGPAQGLGKVIVRRAARRYKWQVKDAPGQEGGTPTYRGKAPPQFELDFHMWTDAQFVYWNTFSLLFMYFGDKNEVQPVDIYTPQLNLVGITQIHVLDLGAPEQQGEKLYWIATVAVQEYFPPIAQNATVTPTGAATANPDAPGATPDPAIDELQKQIQAATTQAVNDGVLSPAESGLP